jgi:uncharacterized protein YcbK (DUF882 family)
MITKINTNMKLSEHFTLAELTKTSVMIENVPNEAQVNNLKRVCQWLERLRQKYNLNIKEKIKNKNEEPIVINSGYRSPQVNKAVGGAANSNHLTGCAVDIRVAGMEQLLRYAVILLDIADEGREDFDELLMERNAKGNYWLHFAVRPEGNRRKIVFLRV